MEDGTEKNLEHSIVKCHAFHLFSYLHSLPSHNFLFPVPLSLQLSGLYNYSQSLPRDQIIG